MVRKYLCLFAFISLFACRTAPPVETPPPPPVEKSESTIEKKIYRSSYTTKMSLIHTRLSVVLNFKKQELYGQAAIILKPYFYSTDSLILDAKGMELKEVSLVTLNKRIPLKYTYDSLQIRMKLDKQYKRDESFTIFIDYISRPNQLPKGGSEAIAESKGLYFINPDGSDKNMPVQVWTQGETESNSCWFPTIESPTQRMTQELYITVDSSMKTLSNGLLLSSENNYDGTRTDYWKQSLPAAPYLTMIAAGDFAIVKDTWNNIEVSYYVDPPYEKYARLTFGKTPAMMTFFSNLLGVPYAWEKYSQIVVHDYISGAMENTTATVHGTNMHQDPREVGDDNEDEYISHELFHHWFGDLITCESWSNVTLNEGFANYSEYLWREHENGIQEADYWNQNDLGTYLFVAAEDDPPLIRFNYDNREDLYDAISYNKGGRVLHMLRSYVGDDAFFQTLQNYLREHMFSSVEIEDLRLAFEKTTGEDLHWFFDQWFMQGGHPQLKIDYEWSDSLKTQSIKIKQIQPADKNPVYILPLAVDFYSNGKVERKNIVVENKVQTFTYPLQSKPDLINVDAKKTLLCTKEDNKSNEQYIFQYDHAPLYLDKFEAVAKIGASYRKGTPEAGMMMRALNDTFFGIKLVALQNIGELAMNAPDTVKADIIRLAQTDPKPSVRDRALSTFGKYYSYKENSEIFVSALKDSSYKVNARAFKIISEKDSAKAVEIARVLEKDSASIILSRLSEFYKKSQDDKSAFFRRAFKYCDVFGRYTLVNNLEQYITGNTTPKYISNGCDVLIEQAKKPQVDFIKTACVGSMEEISKFLDKKIYDLQTSLDTTEPRKEAEIRSDISQLSSTRKSIQEELTLLKKSEK